MTMSTWPPVDHDHPICHTVEAGLSELESVTKNAVPDFSGGGEPGLVKFQIKMLPNSVQAGNFNWNRTEMALVWINPAARPE